MILSAALMCMSLNIYHESRGEGLVGQRAVAQVTWNRAKRDSGKVCEVVVKRRQFSWTIKNVKYRHGQYVLNKKMYPIDKKAWVVAKRIALLTMGGVILDFTHGATFYHANYVNPGWNKGMRVVAVIGQHKFYKLA